MLSEWRRGLGFLVILVPPALLVAGASYGRPYLAFVAVFVITPFFRVILGDVEEKRPIWSEGIASLLDRLPLIYCGFFVLCLAGFLWQIHTGALRGPSDWILAGLSTWTCFIFATVVAHELVHQRAPGRRLVGRLLAGAAGYPVLNHEHLPHHATSGDVKVAEWPGVNETVWRFALRRTRRVVFSALEYNAALAQRHGSRWHGGLLEACAATLVVAAAFTGAAGMAGLVLYGSVMVGVVFSMQAITYIQHWGLGDDSVPDAEHEAYGWEDGCKAQAWLTLGISFHQAHHNSPHQAFYRLKPVVGSPRLPAGYVILLLAALVPPVWRLLMLPVLRRWQADPHVQLTPGRRLICLSLRS